MFHVRVDNATDKNVTGYECGTRADFDNRHSGDPLWVFVDQPQIRYRINMTSFIVSPTNFRFDTKGFLTKK